MAFAPQTFTKGGKTMVALTPHMAVDLAYNGWALQGAAPARPRSEQPASLGDLDGLSSTYAPRNQIATTPARIVTLIGGGPDESPTNYAGQTVTVDTTNYKLGQRAWKVTQTSGTTAKLVVPLPLGTINPGKIATVSAWVWLEDATKVTAVTLYVPTVGGTWSRGHTGTGSSHNTKPLVTGWNLIRITASSVGQAAADYLSSGITHGQVQITTNAFTSFTVGHMYVETPKKASIILVNDWGNSEFLRLGYPDCKARRIPVTWGLKTTLLGTGTVPDRLITWADVATLASDGNENAIAFHSYDGTATSGMTADQAAADTIKAIKNLEVHGYKHPLWRPSWVQNLATNPQTAYQYLLGCAMSNDSYGMISWPPPDRYMMRRRPIHDSPTATIDADFALLKSTNGLGIFYTHGIDPAGATNHSTPEEWAYWLSKVDQGISEGWLECVTFEQLWARDGGRVRKTFGDHRAEYLDHDGNAVAQRLV